MKAMFVSAAWFNWIVSFLLIFAVKDLFSLLGVAPLPTEPLFVHFLAIVVFVFGIGYYWAAKDFENHQNIIKLGALAKLLLVAVGIIDWQLGIVSWQIMLILVVDFVYSFLFYRACVRFRLAGFGLHAR